MVVLVVQCTHKTQAYAWPRRMQTYGSERKAQLLSESASSSYKWCFAQLLPKEPEAVSVNEPNKATSNTSAMCNALLPNHLQSR